MSQSGVPMSETLSTDGREGAEWNGEGLPESGTLYYYYLENSLVGTTIDFDLQPDADELDEDERKMCQFLVTKVADDKWLRDGHGEEDRPCTTWELFNHLKIAAEGEHEVVVARGKDPRVVKKEMVDAGREHGQMSFFSINVAIDLTKDDDDEDIPVSELRRCNGKSLYEKVRRHRIRPCPCWRSWPLLTALYVHCRSDFH